MTGYLPYYNYNQLIDNSSSHRGVAILVKRDITHRQIQINDLINLEAVAVEVSMGMGQVVVFVSAYQSPSKSLLVSDLDRVFNLAPNIVTLGDLNAQHHAWNCLRTNYKGNLLIGYCLRQNVEILYPYQHTRVPTRAGDRPSTIDIILSKNVTNICTPVAIPSLSSDHNPVISIISKTIPVRPPLRVYQYNKANWKKFRVLIDEQITANQRLQTTKDIDTAIEKLTSTIHKSAAMSIPETSIKPRYFNIPADLKNKIKTKNYFRRQFQRFRTNDLRHIYVNLSKEIQLELVQWRNHTWNVFLGQLNPQRGTLWKMTKYCTRKRHDIPSLVTANGNTAVTDKQKAQALANHFLSNHELMLNTPNYVQHTRFVKKAVSDYISLHSKSKTLNKRENFVKPITIFRIIKQLKNKKSPGIDTISALMLKNLSRKALVLVTSIFNASLRCYHFPHAWKTARVIPIHKKGKPSNLATSYRPISLLSTLGKVYEKVIEEELTDFTNVHKIIPDEQFGFKQGHSTVAQLARLTDYITDAFNERKYTGMVLLDIQAAFDTTWHDGLLYKMIKREFPPNLILLIHSYLSKRQFYVQMGSENSQPISPPAGVPQGSRLAPKLFCIYISDFPLIKDVHLSQYADDTALFCKSWRLETISSRLSKAYANVKRYFDRWKIKINENKTEAILFTKRRPDLNNHCITTGKNNRLNWKRSVNYLGVLMDYKLTFTAHVNNVRSRALRCMVALFPIFNKKSALGTDNKLLIYKLCIRPILTYAAPVWSLTCASNFAKLQRVQNRALKIAANLPRLHGTAEVHESLDFPLLHSHVHSLTTKFFDKVKLSSNSLINEIGNYDATQLADKYKRRHKHKRTKHILLF